MLIYKDIRFDDYLEATYKRGGIAAHAARKAEDIIQRLTRLDAVQVARYLVSTGQGENRIEDCRKIGLPGGYRLVFILKDNLVIFCFIGEHDDCHRWIESNKKLRYEQFDERLVPFLSHLTDYTNDLAIDNYLEDFDREPFFRDTLPEEYLQEQSYIDAYEEALLSRINTIEGQRTIMGWFR